MSPRLAFELLGSRHTPDSQTARDTQRNCSKPKDPPLTPHERGLEHHAPLGILLDFLPAFQGQLLSNLDLLSPPSLHYSQLESALTLTPHTVPTLSSCQAQREADATALFTSVRNSLPYSEP